MTEERGPLPVVMALGATPAEAPSRRSRKRPRLLEDAVKGDEGSGDGSSGVSLRFSDSFALDNQNMILMQVTEPLLKEIGEDAEQGLVQLIGDEEENVVLVTGEQTFRLTKAETSNTLLMVPPEDNEDISGRGSSAPVERDGDSRSCFEAVAAVGCQYELSKTTPSLEQIRSILEKCLYQGMKEEASVDPERLKMCSLDELQKRVQFSRRELLAGLSELDAILVEGRWRMVDPALMERTANDLLAVIVEQDMPLDRIDLDSCVEHLPNCEPSVLEHCLRAYSRSADGTTKQGTVFFLDLDKVARLRAHQILRARETEADFDDKPLRLRDFLEQWASSMPGIDTPEQDLLKGIALIERRGGDDKNATVAYVPASALPFSPAARLAALFRVKPKWPMAELEPYISEADKKAGFLLKNTRFSTDPTTGEKLFSAR